MSLFRTPSVVRPGSLGRGARWPVAAWLAASCTALLATPSPAQADGSSEPEVSREPPVLSLTVEENGPTVPWRLEVRNTGATPVMLSADPRLLWFEVKVPGRKKVETCRLPAELFPSQPAKEARLRLEPGEAAAQQFDPRLYCYAEGGQWQLVPGSQITPHFGWPATKKTSWKAGKKVETVVDAPPYVAHNVAASRPGERPKDEDGEAERGAKVSAAGHVKVLDAPLFALDSSYIAWARSRMPDESEPDGPFELKLTAGSDASTERTATVTLTLKNRSPESRYVYFRRELVSYEVMGPDGLVQCDPEPDLREPERHGFSQLAAGETLSATSRLVELCPRGTFARPGLYLVHARFDANQAGDEFDLDAFVGRAVTRDSVGVRVRTGEKRPLRLRRVAPAPSAAPDEEPDEPAPPPAQP